jgi:hypothetical protein
MRKTIVLAVTVLLSTVILHAQNLEVYPTHWWVAMKNPVVQLMIHSENIGNGTAAVTITYPGVKVVKVHKVENKNYLFVDINIASAAKAGTFKFR